MPLKKVAIVFGGRSAEHEISILSAKNVSAALDRKLFELILIAISKEGTWYEFSSENVFEDLTQITDQNLPQGAEPISLICQKGQAKIFSLNSRQTKNIDIAFPVLHGTFGEDGSIQGLFKMANLPFVGCGVHASSAGMDKEVMKRLLLEAKIPSAKYLLLTPQEPKGFESLSKQLGTPFFIKPSNMGSSVGVHKIKNKNDFESKIKDAFLYDHKVLAEEFIEGQEIECSVMGHNLDPKASVCGEVTPTHEFYSYEAKYLDENGATLKIPADIDSVAMTNIQSLAKKTFQVMGCEGLTRVDFFLKKNGEVMVNEINTIPGFTKISMYPKMWEASGLDYTGLITQLIHLGLEKFKQEQSLKTNFRD